MNTLLLYLGIFLSVAIRIFFIAHGTNVADIKLLFGMGDSFLKGLNPYLYLTYNSYPPVAVYIEAFTILFSRIINIPFHQLTKLWPNIADVLICLILYKSLIKFRLNSLQATFWSLVFVLNPISIIISSIHGQLDSIPSLFVLISIYLLTLSKKIHINSSALFLGLAVAIKPNPLILLPYFLIYKNINLKQKLFFLVISLGPVILTLIPYLSNLQILGRIFEYLGVYDFSYAAILRGFWYQQNAARLLPLSTELLNASKLSFILGAGPLLILFYKSTNLTKMCLVVYLLFLSIYFGISAQYLSWILPLAILAREKKVIYFSLAGSLALIGFYTFFGPDILFGKSWNGLAFQSVYMLPYFVGNLFLWIITLWWFIMIINNYMKARFHTFSLIRKRIFFVFLFIFIVSLIPILRFSFLIIQQSFQI